MLESKLETMQDYVENLVIKHKVPAISMAAWHNDKIYKGASGVLNTETGVQATTDSIFQIGSIAKVFTASLVMQLVDEEKVTLDAPIKNYLKDFHVACPEATESITVRQLLTHTSGMAGDFFPEDGAACGDPLARYMDRCYLLPQEHPVGKMFSYSNSAFNIAGRLIEVVSGLSWSEAIDERIVKPLGLSHVAITPQETIRFRTAIGHKPDPKNKHAWIPVSQCYLPLTMAPSGSVLSMTAIDLITFGLASMQGGRSVTGAQWLSNNAALAMQTPQVSLPPHPANWIKEFGIGWMLLRCGETSMFGHGGQVIGQNALLIIIPEHNLIFSFLLNGCGWLGKRLVETICFDFLKDIVGIDHSEPEFIQKINDPERFCGRYGSFGFDWEVEFNEGVLSATTAVKSLKTAPEKVVLRPLDDNNFVACSSDGERQMNITFLKPDNHGATQYLFNGFGLSARVDC